jgi:hypothetical protein
VIQTNRLIPLRSDQLRSDRRRGDAASSYGIIVPLSPPPFSLIRGQSRDYCSVRRKQQWSHKISLTEDPIVAETEIRASEIRDESQPNWNADPRLSQRASAAPSRDASAVVSRMLADSDFMHVLDVTPPSVQSRWMKETGVNARTKRGRHFQSDGIIYPDNLHYVHVDHMWACTWTHIGYGCAYPEFTLAALVRVLPGFITANRCKIVVNRSIVTL